MHCGFEFGWKNSNPMGVGFVLSPEQPLGLGLGSGGDF
ncbi:hypothetical protein A2U01_0119449, partial [Trifolium medium]|nr:hypothetical protein [Trifolium medium]